MNIASLNWNALAVDAVKNLPEKELWFPDLQYNGHQIDPITPSSRLSKSLRAICTNLREKEFFDAANSFASLNEINNLSHEQMADRHAKLHGKIYEKIATIKDGGEYDEDSLCEVFHLIQLWGGNTGRNIYVKGDGFAANWCYESYKNIAQICIGAEWRHIRNTISDLDNEMGNINQWGLAFASKHYSFWNGAGHDPHLAIFDSVLSRGLFGVKTPTLNLYRIYLETLAKERRDNGTSIQNIERKLFNYFQSVEGAVWIAVRMRDEEEV
jgi:hypothetical protein